mgnify:FL=1
MVPVSSIASVTETVGPQIIFHYNGYRSIKLQASQAEGYSSGQAIAALNEAIDEVALPGLQGDWIGLA